MEAHLGNLHIGQRLINFFYEGLVSKYFRLCGLCMTSVATVYLSYCGVKAAIDNT